MKSYKKLGVILGAALICNAAFAGNPPAPSGPNVGNVINGISNVNQGNVPTNPGYGVGQKPNKPNGTGYSNANWSGNRANANQGRDVSTKRTKANSAQ
jgi:hypothetical protein